MPKCVRSTTPTIGQAGRASRAPAKQRSRERWAVKQSAAPRRPLPETSTASEKTKSSRRWGCRLRAAAQRQYLPTESSATRRPSSLSVLRGKAESVGGEQGSGFGCANEFDKLARRGLRPRSRDNDGCLVEGWIGIERHRPVSPFVFELSSHRVRESDQARLSTS